jgi:shikimate dehydrogenase
MLSAATFPTGTTRVFPVLGDPIDQVRSPQVLTRLMATQGRDALVIPLHVKLPELKRTFEALHAIENIGGMLITIPHKQRAFTLCSTTSDRADFVGAVNVVRRTDHGWDGDNTDGLGYLEALRARGFEIAGRRALLIGCGGAGSAIALELLTRGATQVAIHDIDLDRRDAIIDRLNASYPGKIVPGSTDPTGYDLVANATPVGMRKNDPLPVDVAKLEPWQFVACVITKPEVPPLIAEAMDRGCGTMTGSQMFDAQADDLVAFLTTNPA